MLTGDVSFALVFPLNACVVPNDINGPVAIYVTNSSQPLLSNVVERETNSVVAGPTMGFIDTVPQQLSMLALTDSATNQTSVTTQTITPSQASVIISSASPSAASPTDGASSAAPTDGASSAAPTDGASSAAPSDGASSAAPTDGSSTDSVGGSASPTGTASSASPSGVSGGNNNAAGSTDVVPFPGGPNEYQGPSDDGSITVNGWSSIPNSTVSASSS